MWWFGRKRSTNDTLNEIVEIQKRNKEEQEENHKKMMIEMQEKYKEMMKQKNINN
ncbi:hypothetical protein TetV_506 [Tetraselmis virus 1]|uniref:Uncharacterized protein n=1 Tax=Tetraselmis virus 1 TaxID=2060617 RepID=A0A2P0VNV9_9VIRU|nr:hypothetical protein QJ968_gp548 [Tetraselmis virus 1]AUF82588.1 hypothetical protein TetV_506 [Tetraselmis virus 1]